MKTTDNIAFPQTVELLALVDEAGTHGYGTADIAATLVAATRAARDGRDQEAGDALRHMVNGAEALKHPVKRTALEDLADSKVLGIHLAAARDIVDEEGIFDRDHVGAGVTETDVRRLIEASFAEWKTRQTSASTIVVYRLGEPKLLYVNADWQALPDQLNDTYLPAWRAGRKYIAAADVIPLAGPQAGKLLHLTTDELGDAPAHVNLTDPEDLPTQYADLYTYARSHGRLSPTKGRQPVDLLNPTQDEQD